MKKGKVVGIGGIFFKDKDPSSTKEWYSEHLGMVTDQWGAPFQFRKNNNPDEVGFLQWSPMADDTDYLNPSLVDFMINYRVVNIEALVSDLKEKGVTICDEITAYDYGKFVHILDHAGRKIELWEPVDSVFDGMYKGETNKE